MSEKLRLRVKYWTVLFNLLFLVLYIIGLRTLYLLCLFGGVRRRLPIIVACVLIGVLWIIIWTFIYLGRKRKGSLKVAIPQKALVLFLCLEIIVLLVSSLFYGVKIVESAKGYNGKLSWKIEEWENSRQIKFLHNNIYKDGVQGIFNDLEKELDLPSELYIANKFSLEFEEDGTITDIYSFFYGREADGEEHTYLLDYSQDKGSKLTVWLDGYAECNYEDSMKIEPMFQILDRVDIKKHIQEWNDENGVNHFGLLYYGYHTFASTEGIVAVNEDGSIDAFEYGISPEYNSGYEVSLYVPEQEGITPVRYMNMWEKVNTENSEEKDQEKNYEIGTCTTDPADGTLYFYMDQNQGWRLVVADAACGSRFYQMEFTADGGNAWGKINEDPFIGDTGVAEGIVFFDQELGFIGMGTATEEYSDLYVTKDGGKSFENIKLPMQEIPEEVIGIEDYDYEYMPYMKDSVINLVLGKEKNNQEDGLLFQSEDHGESWRYAGLTEIP